MPSTPHTILTSDPCKIHKLYFGASGCKYDIMCCSKPLTKTYRGRQEQYVSIIIMSSICSQVEITAVWTDICSKFTRTPKMPYHRYRSKLQGGEKLSEPVRDQLPAHHQGETTRQSPGPGHQVSVAVKSPVEKLATP